MTINILEAADLEKRDSKIEKFVDAEKTSKQALLDEIEKIKPASKAAEAIKGVSKYIAGKLIEATKFNRGQSIEQLARHIKDAFREVCQANNVEKILAGIPIDDNQKRQDFWAEITSGINIATIVDDWLKKSDMDIPRDQTVLEHAKKYAQHVLDLTIAFNW